MDEPSQDTTQVTSKTVTATTSSNQDQAPARDGLTQKVLAYIVTCGFFSIVAVLVIMPLPESQTVKDVLLIMIGILGTAWTGIIAYYFGSSSGSAAKTQLMANKP